MAVLAVATWRVNPGRLPNFLALCVEARTIHERLGAQVRVVQAAAGPRPLAITYIQEFEDTVKYGEFVEKANADQEWQALIARVGSETQPVAELIESSLAADVNLPA